MGFTTAAEQVRNDLDQNGSFIKREKKRLDITPEWGGMQICSITLLAHQGSIVRTILFGEGTAQTTIPDDWHMKSTPRGVVTAAPKQNVAFLWLSTISWEMPEPDFSPASYALQKDGGKEGVRSEHHPDFVILYCAGEGVERGMTLDVHQFKIAPKRAVNGRCAMAFVTLSVKHEGRDLPVARDSVDAAWAAARGVAFKL